jgi:hypothetical protein
MSGSLDAWVTRGRPVAPPSSAAEVVGAALRDGAERVEVELSDARIVATRPPPAKKQKPAYFTKTVAGRTGVPRPQHVVPFAAVLDEALACVGDAAFEYVRRGTPLAAKGQTVRGAIAEAVVKRSYELETDLTVVAAESSEAINGANRGRGTERYDFGLVDGDGAVRKIEVKNARMTYQPLLQLWKLNFVNVKTTEFYDLVLCFEGFDGLRLYKWGGEGESTNGVRQEATGGSVFVHASRSQPDALAAHAQLITKMEVKGNKLLAFVAYDDPDYSDLWSTTTRTTDVYEHVPLGTLSHTARGNALEGVVRAVVRDVIGHAVTDAPVTARINGAARGANSTSCDFLVDGRKAEVKSSLMHWDKYRRCFCLQFKHVKATTHDVLYLAWMTPRGIHIFQHDSKAGLRTTGKATEATGKGIGFTAPSGKKGFPVASGAERFLLKNLNWLKLPYLAFLPFADGDFDRVMERGKRIRGVEGGDDVQEESTEDVEEESTDESDNDEDSDED